MNTASQRIFHALLGQIKNGQLAPGDAVPKETNLAKRHDTSRMNAHWAMRELEAHGLVVRKKRVGTFAAEKLDSATVLRLFNASAATVRVLYSTNPQRIHWDDTSFSALEATLKPADLVVDFHTIPDSGRREDLTAALAEIESAGSRALVIFPDTADMHFLIANKDLIGGSLVPTYVLNRGGAPLPFTNVSDVSMDPLGEGARVGKMLRDHPGETIAFIGEENEFWSRKRRDGVLLGLTDEAGNHPPVDDVDVKDDDDLRELRGRVADASGQVVVVTANNAVAARFIDFAAEESLTPPVDFQLIAFDDNPLYRSYALTSMAQPLADVGRTFGEMILDHEWMRRRGATASVRVASHLVNRKTFTP